MSDGQILKFDFYRVPKSYRAIKLYSTKWETQFVLFVIKKKKPLVIFYYDVKPWQIIINHCLIHQSSHTASFSMSSLICHLYMEFRTAHPTDFRPNSPNSSRTSSTWYPNYDWNWKAVKTSMLQAISNKIQHTWVTYHEEVAFENGGGCAWRSRRVDVDNFGSVLIVLTMLVVELFDYILWCFISKLIYSMWFIGYKIFKNKLKLLWKEEINNKTRQSLSILSHPEWCINLSESVIGYIYLWEMRIALCIFLCEISWKFSTRASLIFSGSPCCAKYQSEGLC